MKYSKLRILLLFIFFLIFNNSSDLYAQTWDEIIKLTASDGEVDDLFGYAVDIEGNQAIVGAYGKDNIDPIDNTGAAYIFEFIDGEWTETQKLVPSDADGNEHFGVSVSISGDFIIVGAHQDHGAEFYTGSAYVFKYEGGLWLEMEKLTASDPSGSDRFGSAVSIDAERAVVGSYGNDDDGSNSGSVYIFELIDGTFWVETEKLTASDAEAGAFFGRSVSNYGNEIAIGANGDDDQGSVYVFELIGGFWIEVAKLNASDADVNDNFGLSVDVNSGNIVVGAIQNDDFGDNSGSAYVFEKVLDEWTEVAKLTPSDAAEGDLFGWSVSIDTDVLVVGSHRDDDEFVNSGSAYIFALDGGDWVESQKIVATEGIEDAAFGTSVALHENNIIVGAGGYYLGFGNGSAYIFSKCAVLPDVTANTDETEICEGDSIVLTGGGAETFTWEDGVIDGEPFSPEIGTTTYSVVGTNAEGCENTATIDITVYERPSVTAVADDNTVCLGDEVTLNGDGATSYIWDGGVTDGVPFSPEIGITTYMVIGTDDNGCEDTAFIDITVLEALAITYEVTPALMGDDGAIDLTVSGGLPVYTFDWDIDGTGDYDDDEDQTGLTVGLYTVHVLDDAGCESSETAEVSSQLSTAELDNVLISVYPNPAIDIVNIECDGQFSYRIVAPNGQVIISGQATEKTMVDMSDCSKGVYVLEVVDSLGAHVTRLVKR